MNRKVVLGLCCVVAVAGVAGAVGWIINEKNMQLATAGVSNTGVISLQVEEPKVNGVLWGNGYMSVASDGVRYVLKLVTDGEVLMDRFEIKTKEGEVLATTRVSVRGFYLDKSGNLQSVIVPQLVELADDKLYLIRTLKYVDWNEAQISEKIKTDPRLFDVGTKGLVTYVTLSPDVDVLIDYLMSKYFKSGGSIPEAYSDYSALIDRYNRSWSAELGRFYDEGTKFVNIVFPIGIAAGGLETSDLYARGETIVAQ